MSRSASPEDPAPSLVPQVRKIGRNVYTVPGSVDLHTVTLLGDQEAACTCPWGRRAGTFHVRAEGISTRPCKHLLAVAGSGAVFSVVEALEADPFARLRDHKSGCSWITSKRLQRCDCVEVVR